MINLLFNKIKYILYNLVVNLLIILLTLILYLILILYSILFIFNINNIEKIIKYYLKFISLIVGISLIYILYESISFVLFTFVLFVFILFSLIIITYRNSLFKVSSKFIHLLLVKDYTFIIQRVLLVKFLLLYVYITTDYTYCDSFITRAMHDVFVSMGKTSHVEPQKTVSTMETMGMLATIGIIGYASIKLYQLSTNTLPKSTDEKLDEMEKRIMKKLEEDKTEFSSKIESVYTNLYYTVEDAKNTGILAQKEYADMNVNHFTNIAMYMNKLDNELQDLKVLVLSNRDSLNKAVKEELVGNLKKIEDLIVKSNELHKKSTNLSPEDLEEFERLQKELSSELGNHNTILSNLPSTSNILRRNTPDIPVGNFNHYMGIHRNSTFKQNQNIVDNVIRNNTIIPLNLNRSSSNINLSSSNNSIKGKTFEITDISDTNIVFTAVDTLTSTSKEVSTSIINRATMRAFHVGSDVIVKVVKDQLSNIIQGSITYTAFISVLQALGVIGEKPSNSENAGRIISTNIRQFITGITGGMSNK